MSSDNNMQQLLERFPNFAKQWRACHLKLAADGTFAKAGPIGADTEQRLAAEQMRLLKAKTLLTAIEELAKDGYLQETTGEAASPITKHDTGKTGPSHSTLVKAIQVLKASQRLQLPDALLPKDSSAAEPKPDAATALCGSSSHLLGVTPADLLALELPNHQAIKAAAKALMPEVEASLHTSARNFAQALQDIFPSADPTADVGELLKSKVAQAAELRRQEAGALGECVRAGGAQVAALQQHVEVLQELLVVCKVQRQGQVDKVHSQYKLDHIKALTKKAEHAEAALLLQTYVHNKSMLPALQQAAALVRAAHAEASASVKQLRAQLAAYKELGPEFQGVVREYEAVQGELQRTNDHVKRMLAFQQELEAEAQGGLLG